MKTTKTYAGISEEYAKIEQAKIVLIPVSFDGTSTWQKGANHGPKAFLEASENMELYDIETDSEVYKEGVFLANEITGDDAETVVNAVHEATKQYINRNKFVTIFGGEHSISIGTIRAFNECFDNISVLHIDAHADLRKEYNGSKYNHACAVYEANQTTNLVQVGIRSMDASERNSMNFDKVFFAHEMAVNDYWMDEVLEQLTDNVFITFDLDAMDPSLLPSTGTPEPGGLFYYETLTFLKQVFEAKNVVGFDMVELCPNPTEKSSDFLAAKLYYKMLSYKFASNDDNYDSEELDSASPFSKLSKFKNNDEDDF